MTTSRNLFIWLLSDFLIILGTIWTTLILEIDLHSHHLAPLVFVFILPVSTIVSIFKNRINILKERTIVKTYNLLHGLIITSPLILYSSGNIEEFDSWTKYVVIGGTLIYLITPIYLMTNSSKD